ncbi:MAG: XDD4 family exosortase-dependent surface protein [Planctomycetota bacterium]|jgi:hypothetical protein
MISHRFAIAAVALLAASAPGRAEVMVNYTIDAGGMNPNPLNGMTASATFEINGQQLTILLANTSTGAPVGSETADSLLVSVGFNLINGITIVSGDSAVIGPGSVGIGAWAGLTAGADVGDEWLWTNDGGGDLMEAFAQVISTSDGQGGGDTMSFNGEAGPNVDGPFGGIAADPPLKNVPDSKPAVSDSILFTLTLSGTLSEAELSTVAQGSLVEFGSDFQYLAVPGPGSLGMFVLGMAGGGLRRRRA